MKPPHHSSSTTIISIIINYYYYLYVIFFYYLLRYINYNCCSCSCSSNTYLQYTTTTIICVRSSQTILISPNHYMQLPFLEVDCPALALTARFCRMHKRGIRRPSTAGLSSSNSRGRLFPFLSGDLKSSTEHFST